MADQRPNPIATKLYLQRIVLLIERLWLFVHRPMMVLGLGLALAWSGLLIPLPKGFALMIFSSLGALFIWTLKPLLGLALPSRHAAARALENHNTLAHRAASSLEDVPVAGAGSEELWQAHVERNLAALKTLKIAPPRSSWRQFDPLAQRLPMVMAVVIAYVLGTGDIRSNVLNAFNFGPAPLAKIAVLDAWLKPPSYTGKPPLLLTSPAMLEKLTSNPDLTIPENATLSVRLQGAAAPKMMVLSPSSTDLQVTLAEMKQEEKDGIFIAEAKLDRPASIKIFDGEKPLATWNIALITDQPPTITFADEPKGNDFGKLSVKWHVTDDYGVKSVTAEINLADEQDKAMGFADNGIFLYSAPEFKLAMSKPNTKDDTETSTADLSAHPWAGLWAEMVLTATDGAGHTTSTPPKRFKMPERNFIMPLARALAEQRKRFILSPDDAPDASTMISAMLLYPFELKDRFGLQINLSRINSQLAKASHPDDVVAVVKDIWPLMLSVENGNLNDIKTQLKELANQLREAMREGAPKERIDELMKKMQEAMNKLAEQMKKNDPSKQAQGLKKDQGPSKTVTPEQLQSMLDEIDRLNKQGDTDKAEQMLSQLDEMLQNLRPGESQQAGGDQPGQGQMDSLSDLLGKQQKLMDQTQRLGKGGDKGDAPGDLANKQEGLGDQLGKLGDGLSPEDGGDKLGEAGKNMRDAEDALRRGNKEEALRQQNKAMRNMLQGMKKLAEKMGKDGKGNQQGNSQSPGNNDPLGRPQRSHKPGEEPDRNLVPSDLTSKRAHEILKELRDRANEQGLDDETKDYIDGLLKGVE